MKTLEDSDLYEEIVTLISYYIVLKFQDPPESWDFEGVGNAADLVWSHHETNLWAEWCYCLSSIGITETIDHYNHRLIVRPKIGEPVSIIRHVDEPPLEAFLEILSELQLNNLYEGKWGMMYETSLPDCLVSAALDSTYRDPPSNVHLREVATLSGREFYDDVLLWLTLCNFNVLHRLGLGEIDRTGDLVLKIAKPKGQSRGSHEHCCEFARSLETYGFLPKERSLLERIKVNFRSE